MQCSPASPYCKVQHVNPIDRSVVGICCSVLAAADTRVGAASLGRGQHTRSLAKDKIQTPEETNEPEHRGFGGCALRCTRKDMR
jgi:hypothetical protein